MRDDIVIQTADGVTSFGLLDEATGKVKWFAHAGAAALLTAAAQGETDERRAHLKALLGGVDLDAVQRRAEMTAQLVAPLVCGEKTRPPRTVTVLARRKK